MRLPDRPLPISVIILTIGFMTNNSMGGGDDQRPVERPVRAWWRRCCASRWTPLMEAVFRLATPAKLLELSNPNQPIAAPAADRSLRHLSPLHHRGQSGRGGGGGGGRPIPCCAAREPYYHDIGKLKRPMYFKENQLGENPHEHTNPYISAAIVTAHTRDGVMLAQQYHLPQEIQDIIIEHHGDTPVMYFYHKALKQADGQAVDIADFRYDGRRPQSKESAIIMLADTVEAAVRSMH